MLGVAAAPAILQFIVILFMPETQRWLAYNEKWEECKETLDRVYPEEAAKIELKALRNEVNRIKRYIKMTECERYG